MLKNTKSIALYYCLLVDTVTNFGDVERTKNALLLAIIPAKKKIVLANESTLPSGSKEYKQIRVRMILLKVNIVITKLFIITSFLLVFLLNFISNKIIVIDVPK